MYPYNVIVCGCTKNSASYIYDHMTRLYSMHDMFQKFHMVVYENDSSDNTRELLDTFKKNNPLFEYISETNVISTIIHKVNIRPQIIGHGRNRILDYIENHKETFDYVIMVDLDSIIANFQKKQITHIFDHDPSIWDGLFANCIGKYYDIWALRINENIWSDKYHSQLWKAPINYDCWEMVYHTKDRQKYVYDNQVVIPNTSALIPVSSAFGGFGIYKYNIIKGCRYNCIRDNKITCEHVDFHHQIFQKHYDAKFFICPKLLMNTQPEHTT